MSNSEDEIMIQPSTKRVKLNECENEDRLSDLPDCVILHILSCLNARNAVQTCVLSTRWKNLWKRIPALKLHYLDFRNYKKFTKFVSNILSLRDSSSMLHTLDFKRNNGRLEPHILKKIVNYTISHNVQRFALNVTGDIAQVPPTLFSSQTLTYLKLSMYDRNHETLFPKSLDLPALTSLKLENFAFRVGDNDCAEPISTFNRLNSLVISDCTVRFTQTLSISSATLVDLTMYNDLVEFFEIELSTPSLCTFAFSGTPYQRIFGNNVSSLEHVDIDAEVDSYSEDRPLLLFGWLLELANIKLLIVSASTLQVLSLIPGLLKVDLPFLGDLKSLKVKIEEISYEFRMTLCDSKLHNVSSKKEAARIRKAFKLGLEPSSHIPDGIVDFLLRNSPSAKVDFIEPHRPRDL